MTLRPVHRDERAAPVRADIGRFGMRFFLGALSMLFAASIVGYLVVRAAAPEWPPAGSPGAPAGLWVSTALILLSSFTIARAVRAVRAHHQPALRRWTLVTLLLGGAFLIAQVVNWNALIAANLTARSNLYGFTFFMLTGLHAAHVVGGLVPLALVTRGAFCGRYSAYFHSPLEYTATYWHFLDAVWLVLFVVLLLGG